VAFVLGNLTAISNKARLILAQEQEALEIIRRSVNKGNRHIFSIVIGQLIRLVANLSIADAVGPQIARLPDILVLKDLLGILILFVLR
jgi:hypothetical protein